jgi:hypothetical protein
LLPLAAGLAAALWIGPGRKRRFRLAALTLLAFSAPILAERLYSRTVHGSALTSPIGRHAFMKAAMISAPPTELATSDPLRLRLVAALNQDFEPVRRLIAEAPDRNVRYILLTNYEGCAAWSCGNHIARPFAAPEGELHKAMLDAGLARLGDAPLGYVALTASEYHRMWLLHPRKHPDLAAAYNAYLEREAPLPFQPLLGEEGRPTPPDQQSPLFRVNRWLFAAMGLAAALLTVLAALFHRNPLAKAGLVLLVGTQAGRRLD